MTVHPSALIEAGVQIGPGSSVWDNVHIRGPATVGANCIIGEKSYVAYGVTIGDRVKVNAFVYICTGVTIEDGVMVSAGAIFTNDLYPRATSSDLSALRSSDPDDDTLHTRVRQGATIGAGATIGPGVDIGRFAMVGMGSVVTRNVPDFGLVVGNPARQVGSVCRCGRPLPENDEPVCEECGLSYVVADGSVRER